MSAAPVFTSFVSVEEYLRQEEVAETKHEYVAGAIYAMSGASRDHNRLASALSGLLYPELKGTPCEFFGSDMKLRLRFGANTFYYYPDAMIACDPADDGGGFCCHPSVVFEIISESTRSIDDREKRIHYLQLESLQAYVRIEQSRPEVLVDRRTDSGWQCETITGLQCTLRLAVNGRELALSLADLYRRVVFPA